MKKTLLFIFAFLGLTNAFSQTEPANYAAVAVRFKIYYNNNKPDSIYKMFGPEMKSVPALATVEQFSATSTQLKAQLGTLNQTNFTKYIGGKSTYEAVFQNGNLVMTLVLNKAGQIAGLSFTPPEVKQVASAIPDDPSLTETPISIKVLGGNISGTITMPKNAPAKVPVVLIIAGSGPTDRDGNSQLGVNSNTYKMIAIALGKSGIASLRYDKRGIAKSITSTKEKDLRFDDYVDDAIALINLLHADSRFSKIIVLGHSEGSLIGMLAIPDQPVSGYISVSGAGDRGDKVITEQLKTKPQFVQDAFKTILDSLKKGKFTDKVDPSLYAIARPSVQPYMLSYFRHDPTLEIKKVKVPTLIIQGVNDIQVTVADAQKLKKAKSDATLLIIPGMNHVLKDAPAEREANSATYKDPNLPLNAELMPGMIAFINKLK